MSPQMPGFGHILNTNHQPEYISTGREDVWTFPYVIFKLSIDMVGHDGAERTP